MRTVAEKDVVAKLDEKLFDAIEALRAGNNSDVHMAPPEIVNYTEGSQLHYNGFGSHGTNFHIGLPDSYRWSTSAVVLRPQAICCVHLGQRKA